MKIIENVSLLFILSHYNISRTVRSKFGADDWLLNIGSMILGDLSFVLQKRSKKTQNQATNLHLACQFN